MDSKLFDELAESVKQLGEIMRGEHEPSRQFELKAASVDDPAPVPDGLTRM
jgi:hypothetical protein